jgi:branched-chain amino acid transport system substrate-binding protein
MIGRIRKILTGGISFAAVAALLLGLGAGAHSALAAEPVRIGSFLAVTGPAAFLGDPEKKTLEMYVKRINDEGGVLGRPVELTVYDTGLDASKAVSFAKRLIEQDKVDIIVGGTTTGETMAVIKAVDPQIPFISLAGASVIIDPVKKWVFKTPHTDRMAVEKVYRDMNKLGYSRVGLIAGEGGFDKSCMANAEELAGQYGITVAAKETYGRGDTDMTPQLTNIRNANVDAVFFCGFGAPATIVARNFHQLGMKAQYYNSHGVCSKQFIEGAGAAAEGVRMPCAAVLVADQLPPDDPQAEVAQGYAHAYKKRWGEDVSTFGGHAYDALNLAVNAIEQAGSTDPAAVRDALESTKNFIGADGIFNMSPQDHMGLDLRSFKMVEIKNGDWKLEY